MIWDQPFELFKDEYETTVKCLKQGVFYVDFGEGDTEIIVYRKSTGEPVLFHFFPYADDIKYDKQNEKHTYYQVNDIFPEEQKEPEELPRQIVLEDPETVQKFLNEIIHLQKEYSDNSKEE